jgi:hypothetical protein
MTGYPEFLGMTWPAVLSWILIFAGLLSRSPLFLLYLFFGFGAFGSVTLLSSERGSVNLLPQAICSIFLILQNSVLQGSAVSRGGYGN